MSDPIVTLPPITQHAVESFVKRLGYIGFQVPKKPANTLSRMLRVAKPEQPNIHMLLRQNRYRGKTEFLRTPDGWRLVICNGVLVTVEHVNPLNNR